MKFADTKNRSAFANPSPPDGSCLSEHTRKVCDALDAAIRSMELLEVATEIAFTTKFMHRMYKAGGQRSITTEDEWNDSPLEVYARIEERER